MISLLDCTLRDGGYINDWHFGIENAKHIVNLLTQSNVEFVELGFLRNIPTYDPNKMIFKSIDDIDNFLSDICVLSSTKFAIMLEMGNSYPIEKIRYSKKISLIRLVVWKRIIDESIDYVKKLISYGYDVMIQFTRTDQYEFDEFCQFVNRFQQIGVYGIYIVDTFGRMDIDLVLKYVKILDKCLGKNKIIGYHTHNNMQHAYANAMVLCKQKLDHNILIDGSVLGMGKGAGNLCIETIIRYLNNEYSKKYNIEPIYKCANDFIEPLHNEFKWGYSIRYFLSALYNCNPSYVDLLSKESIETTKFILKKLLENGKNLAFEKEYCLNILEKKKL